MNIDDVITVVNSETAASLCLSKGGWEGWLQCELWHRLNIVKQEPAEREVPYPHGRYQCDLVAENNGTHQWIELKAFGIFRQGDENQFLDDIGKDVWKLDGKPANSIGLCLVVVPRSIGDAFAERLRARGWHGFVRTDSTYAAIYHLEF